VLLQLREDTPLHFAATNGHASMVKLLVERGADVNAKSEVRRVFTVVDAIAAPPIAAAATTPARALLLLWAAAAR
jgi:ankyrin repeat protein